MAEKPILFSGPMVRAILDGRKTQTRRVIKPQPIFDADGGLWYPSHDHKRALHYANEEHFRQGFVRDFGRYQPGDLLWVRETWACAKYENIDGGSGWRYETLKYRADCNWGGCSGHRDGITWNPSVHMPKWAARIWLKVKDVRVEQLQDISEKDAQAEGVPSDGDFPMNHGFCSACNGRGLVGAVGENLGFREDECVDCDTCKKRFLNYWNFLNAKRGYGWDINPWVWVIEFRVAEANS